MGVGNELDAIKQVDSDDSSGKKEDGDSTLSDRRASLRSRSKQKSIEKKDLETKQLWT